MYCKKCGTEQKEGQKSCPKCGTPFVEMVKHSKDKSSEELTETKEQRGEIVEPVDNERIREREPQMKAAGVHPSSSGGDMDVYTRFWGNWKMWAIVVCLFFMFKMCGGVFEETGDEETYEYEQSSNSSNDDSDIIFSSEQDVRMYLSSHSFSSQDGYTLSFSGYANQVSLNGQPLSSNVEIRSVNRSSAVIRTQGPYGNTTFRLSVSGSDGVIEDTNDGTYYYSN